MDEVLLLGFEPFGGEPKNAGWEAMRGLSQLALPDARLSLVELPTSFARAPRELDARLSVTTPRVLLGVGQAGDEDVIAIETKFVNRLEARIADNDGATPRGEPVVRDEPSELEASWDAERVVSRLRAHGLAARVSTDAGRFVCNAFGYHSVLRATRAPTIAIVGFVHVPRLLGLDPEAGRARTARTREALELVVQEALSQAREASLA